MLELRARERAEATILDHIIGTYLTEFVKDVAQETLKSGLLAKRRAEDEVNACYSWCRPLRASFGFSLLLKNYNSLKSWEFVWGMWLRL